MNYFFLFIPFLFSWATADYPVLSYWVAWVGAFWIFYLSITGKIKPLPKDLSLTNQFLRPIVLTQIIYVTYMSLTSIFYFLDVNGYYYFDKIYNTVDLHQINLIAICQRYYSLSHASLVSGILFFMNYKEVRYYFNSNSISSTMLGITAAFSAVSLVCKAVSGLNTLYVMLGQVALVASVIAFAFSLPEKKIFAIVLSFALLGANIINALTSGWKESVIVLIIMLGVFIYPTYKKTVIFIFPIMLLISLYILPTYVNLIREMSWFGEEDSKEAAAQAFRSIQSGEQDLKENNWEFLTGRLSEIENFTIYVQYFSNGQKFYGLTILKQAFIGVVPKVFYPDKPEVEKIAMERVYEAGVADPNSIISAKPPPVTDGYISGGWMGIVISSFIIGALASLISVQSEYLFGGYLWGTGLVFTGLFGVFWRGKCFEFMVSTILWSYIVMILLFWMGRKAGLILRKN